MSNGRLQSSRDDRRRDRDGDRMDRRRRSISPRGMPRRREGGYGEVDSYSSSRDYREREREERYGGGRGGDRRDRDWDRDRGSARRDARRDDDGRRRDNRRDRDLFDDRRRPRDDRDRRDVENDRARDRDDMRQMERQTRQKSGSPPPRKPKEPTPDLTDVVSILQKKRRMTQWDIKPAGYENVTAEQAKLSGMFPLPGAPRQQPMDPSRIQAFMNQPGGQANSAALKPSTARQSKRLFVHNLPASATDESVSEFFNLQLNGLNVTRGVDPCISAQVSKDRTYALLEFKSPEDATNAIAFDGITMEADSMDTSNGASNGAAQGLLIKRPKDYIVPAVTDETENEAGVLSNIVPDTQNKISITRIPVFLTEENVQELLVAFGELKNFILVKDTSSDQSRGIAFCEYVDAKGATDIAVESLNGMELGDSVLKVQRASIGIQQMSGEMSVNAMSMMAGTTNSNSDASRVLCLMNMITPEELMDADEADGELPPTRYMTLILTFSYLEILEDVKEECAKYGALLDVKMPRPTGGSRQNNGIGKIYIKYERPESAQKALAALAGRKFADRTVVVTVFGEEYFDVNAW
jgi:splicing factor U2AF 65 kDa subunit